jgi:hypothetical protein
LSAIDPPKTFSEVEPHQFFDEQAFQNYHDHRGQA